MARSPLRCILQEIYTCSNGAIAKILFKKKINFPEPQCLRNDGKIYMGMANDDLSSNLFENKQVLREIPWGSLSSTRVTYQTTTKQTKANHTLPRHKVALPSRLTLHPTRSKRIKSTSTSGQSLDENQQQCCYHSLTLC